MVRTSLTTSGERASLRCGVFTEGHVKDYSCLIKVKLDPGLFLAFLAFLPTFLLSYFLSFAAALSGNQSYIRIIVLATLPLSARHYHSPTFGTTLLAYYHHWMTPDRRTSTRTENRASEDCSQWGTLRYLVHHDALLTSYSVPLCTLSSVGPSFLSQCLRSALYSVLCTLSYKAYLPYSYNTSSFEGWTPLLLATIVLSRPLITILQCDALIGSTLTYGEARSRIMQGRTESLGCLLPAVTCSTCHAMRTEGLLSREERVLQQWY